MIYTAVNMELPSDEDKHIPQSLEALEETRDRLDAEVTVNLVGVQLVVFLTDGQGVPIGKVQHWEED